MNFLLISPNYPRVYWQFAKALKEKGFNVFAIGDSPYNEVPQELYDNIVEYRVVTYMDKFPDMVEGVNYLIKKYGPMDYIESNNEAWLEMDARLREHYGIQTGYWPSDMEHIKYKSKMKEFFIKGGAKVARYTLYKDIESILPFISEVGYPIFAKPDNGVGASDTHKISCYEDLIKFDSDRDKEDAYIIEEYIDGEIVSFDGIADSNSNAVLTFNEHFPIPNDEVVNDAVDDFYFATRNIPEDFYKLGCNVVKAFNIHKKCFHIEFFKLNSDKPGLANKGEYVAIEVNMRPTGGYSTDLLNIACNGHYYDAFAEIITNDVITSDVNGNGVFAFTVSRKDVYKYVHSLEEIKEKYKDEFVAYGRYPKALADCMGDEYFFAKFFDLEKAYEYKKFVSEKII